MNVSRALLLGGGHDVIFTGNVVHGVANSNAVDFDNRGMGWQASACATNPPGELVLFLNVRALTTRGRALLPAAHYLPCPPPVTQRVPYNTSAVWTSRFPHLAAILDGGLQCVPRFNVIADNAYCAPGQAFIDQSNATIASWQSTAYNNTPAC